MEILLVVLVVLAFALGGWAYGSDSREVEKRRIAPLAGSRRAA